MMQVQSVILILNGSIFYILAHVNENEVVHRKKAQVTLDLVANSPFLFKEVKNNLLRESFNLLGAT